MKIPYRLVVVAGLLVTAVVSGGSLVQRGLAERPSRVNGERLFEAVASQVQSSFVDAVPDSVLYEKAVLGLLQELQDPHSIYLVPERLKRFNESTSGNYVGMGVQVDLRDRWATVLGTLPGSPSELAGLRAGDRIVEVEGRSTRGWTIDETRAALRGPLGTTLSVKVERPGVTVPLAIVVTREEIHRRAVGRAALVRDGVAYVDLNVFSDSTERELAQAIDSLNTAGMRALILDLRGNPGGVLLQGVEVADMFLDQRDVIVRIRGRSADTNREFLDQSVQRWPKLPVVLLVDGGSASASEIVAGALQDHDRALVVGHTSFGKGSAQSLFPVATGGALKLTVARWFTPLGRSIDRRRGSDDPDYADSVQRRAFRTPRGRTVYGGGGITPDVVAGDTTMSPAEEALQLALGSQLTSFRDAMTALALQLKTAHAVSSPDFAVTPAMREALYRGMRERGVHVERGVYDGASVLVSRLLGREIARYALGPAAVTQRVLKEDDVVQRAIALLAGVRSPEELLRRGD